MIKLELGGSNGVINSNFDTKNNKKRLEIAKPIQFNLYNPFDKQNNPFYKQDILYNPFYTIFTCFNHFTWQKNRVEIAKMTNLLHKEARNGQIQPIFICFTFYMVLELLSMKQDVGARKIDKIYVKKVKNCQI